MTTQDLKRNIANMDADFILWTRRHSVMLLRIAIGIVYVWFGALKLVPGLSPAEPLIKGAYAFLPENLIQPFIAFIGGFEVVIGLLFMYGRLPRITTVLMLMQMGGAMSPIVLAPHLIWTKFPAVYTLEGQYVFKDIILITAALVINAATSHRLPGARGVIPGKRTSEIPVDNIKLP